MNFFQRIFQTFIWKLIVFFFVSLLLLALLRFFLTLEGALGVLRAMSRERGGDLPIEVQQIVAWGKYSAAILACLGVIGFVDFIAYVRRTRQYKTVTDVITRFAAGEMELRAPKVSTKEVSELGNAFNSMADQIVLSIDRLKQTDALRRELVANVAHDLGGPVTSIQGFVETILLKDASLSNEDRKGFLGIILSNTKSLSKLIAELFDLSKLDSNVVTLKLQPFSIVTLSEDVASRYNPIAQDKEVSLAVVPPERIPLVYADISLIERVVSNVIDNAIKYTRPGGSVTVSFSAAEGRVFATIRDTGVGIPPEDLPFILERFYRVGKDRSRTTGGTGLGLAIVKKILDLHGSTLTVDSELNRGTTICFSLPQAKKR